MSISRLVGIVVVFCGVVVAWQILAMALSVRTSEMGSSMSEAVEDVWGPALVQTHPNFYYPSPNNPEGKRQIQPISSNVEVALFYQPKKKGLFWYQTFRAKFHAEYKIRNDTPIAQIFYFRFALPSKSSFADFQVELVGKQVDSIPNKDGLVTEALRLGPGEVAPIVVSYETQGQQLWEYHFEGVSKVEDFKLNMRTDFDEIDFPIGTAAPTLERLQLKPGWELHWAFPKWLSPPGIGMAMPSVVNPGPVAVRITFFAPIALLFFFAVLVMLAILRQVSLHPMHFFFIGAACFAFQLIFAYTVDLVPLYLAFGFAALVSLGLNYLYLSAVAGIRFATQAAVAQFAYLILFSYSFFFEGLTGITITVGAVATLALLMKATARVDWSEIFKSKRAKSTH